MSTTSGTASPRRRTSPSLYSTSIAVALAGLTATTTLLASPAHMVPDTGRVHASAEVRFAEFAQKEPGLVRFSLDDGDTWRVSTLPRPYRVTATAGSPDGSILLAAQDAGDDIDARLWRSDDFGDSWSALPSPIAVRGLAVNPRRPQEIFAWGDDNTLLRSLDGARHFNELHHVYEGAIHAVTFPASSVDHFELHIGNQSVTLSSTHTIFFQSDRFRVEVRWENAASEVGDGQVVQVDQGTDVPLKSADSTVMQFFGNDNWELLVKILDARVFNDYFWVFLAAASDVGYDVAIRDTVCGETKNYVGNLGVFQPSTTDVMAFLADCSNPAPPSCVEDDTTVCLGEGRFEVRSTWQAFNGNTGSGRQVLVADGGVATSEDSGLFRFFDPDNWEMLIKVLDGCASNDHFWVFNAATTNLGFTLIITDLETDERRTWRNNVGNAAQPFGRTRVFPCDTTPPPPPPPPPAPEDNASFRLTGAGYNRNFNYNEDDNLIFCRPQNNRMIWIRFARDAGNDGNNSPHIDLDVCNYSGGGNFGPGEPPLLPSCSNGKQFDIFWHDGPATFQNEGDSAPCSLQLQQDGDVLEGTFECRGLVPFGGGSDRLDVTNGSFRCTMP